jgi:hypothetical protein
VLVFASAWSRIQIDSSDSSEWRRQVRFPAGSRGMFITGWFPAGNPWNIITWPA